MHTNNPYIASLLSIQNQLHQNQQQIDDLYKKRAHLRLMRQEAVQTAYTEGKFPAVRIANELGYTRSFIYKLLTPNKENP